MVKISEAVKESRVLLDPRYEREPLDVTAGVRDRSNQSGTPPQERVPRENRILRAHLSARLCLSDPERFTLAEIGKRLVRKALAQVACVAKPDTILAWYRELIANKFDGSKHSRYPGRPSIGPKLESGTASRRHRNEAKPRPGRNSFNRIWRCCRGSTSLRSRSSRSTGW
jgi:hypothetical protein